MEKINENIEKNKIYEALIELKIFAQNNNYTETVIWCDKELDGYSDDEEVPIYRQVDSNMWKARFSIEGYPNQMSKYNPIFLSPEFDQNKVYPVCEQVLDIADITRLTNDMDDITEKDVKKMMITIIPQLKKKKLLCKDGLKDLENYIENKNIAVNEPILDFIGNISPFDTQIGFVNPNTRQLIVDKEYMYEKVIEGIKRKILFEMNTISNSLKKAKEAFDILENKIDFGDNNKFSGPITINQNNNKNTNEKKNKPKIIPIIIALSAVIASVYYLSEIWK